MPHQIFYHILLFFAAVAAGAINSVAGGGTLVSFPALLFVGVRPIMANATNTIALVPGSASAFWGYRNEVTHNRAELIQMGLPSLAGGLVGAFLLLRTTDDAFKHLAPWLMLAATVLFMVQEPITHFQRSRMPPIDQEVATATVPGRSAWIRTMLFQFIVAVYGGFFGVGIGILMLASLGFLGLSNIHHMNALKNYAAVCINGIAALVFILGHHVDWSYGALMAVGAVLGGYGGAGVARRIGQKNVRRMVVVIGLTAAVISAVQLDHPIR